MNQSMWTQTGYHLDENLINIVHQIYYICEQGLRLLVCKLTYMLHVGDRFGGISVYMLQFYSFNLIMFMKFFVCKLYYFC